MQQFLVDDSANAMRLDLFIKLFDKDNSRTYIQSMIKQGLVFIDGVVTKHAKVAVEQGQVVTVKYPDNIDKNDHWIETPISLNILFEDEDILVINKPINLTMHPGAGTNHDTLANGILHYHKQASLLDRAGIVHRLDKDTSGCCVVAKTALAQKKLVQLIADRQVKRKYIALVNGLIDLPGTIDKNIGRHPTRRTSMATVPQGREAITHYKPLIQYAKHTLVELTLETGRTHQIRVHLASLRFPIVGDKLYGNLQIPGCGYSDAARSAIVNYKSQALHAINLAFNHPTKNNPLSFQAKLPDNFCHLLKSLEPINFINNTWQNLLPYYD